MSLVQHRASARLLCGVVAVFLIFGTLASPLEAQTFPQYDHVFLIIMENEGYNGIIGNQYSPILNALAKDYGLATNYSGVGDPSEPNYVAMLGGDTFGISDDNPFWFPGHTVSASNLLSEMEGAGKTWRGYFQNMPSPGYEGYCYPDKCNGIPDADTQYVSKHNGIMNFANLQSQTELGRMYPVTQLSADLAAGTVPNFSYIVPDECHDTHGAPPWCLDSGSLSSLQTSWLITQGDAYVGQLVNQITSSSTWTTGNTAIVITFDEGNTANSNIATIVVTNHGPRGITDKTSYNHYSLLASLQHTFGGLACLVNSCGANLMTPLFAVIGSTTTPALPAPYNFPTSSDTISAQGKGKPASAVSLTGSGWSLQPSYSFGNQDNVLAGVSAASKTDAWAVGCYIPGLSGVLNTLAHHFDGTRWTAYPLPNVGLQQNCLNAVSMPATGRAWAVGYYVSGQFQQKTLIEHFDGTVWSVVPSPSPGALQNILYSIAAISDTDAWAVGAEQDAAGLWHTLTEHWNGSTWSVVDAVDVGSNGNQFFAVTAVAGNNVYAAGQQAGSAFPNEALIEHWNGTSWSVVSSPGNTSASVLPLGVTATSSSLTLVGQEETDIAPYTTYVAAGAPGSLSIQTTPNNGVTENDLFAPAIAADGSTWAVGWYIDPSSGNHDSLVLQGVNGTWNLVSSPAFKSGDDSGLAAITAIPGGGMWAVGVTATNTSNYSTVIEWHP